MHANQNETISQLIEQAELAQKNYEELTTKHNKAIQNVDTVTFSLQTAQNHNEELTLTTAELRTTVADDKQQITDLRNQLSSAIDEKEKTASGFQSKLSQLLIESNENLAALRREHDKSISNHVNAYRKLESEMILASRKSKQDHQMTLENTKQEHSAALAAACTQSEILKEDLRQLQIQYDNVKGGKDTLEIERVELEKRNAALTEDLEASASECTTLTSNFDALRKQYDNLETKSATQLQDLEKTFQNTLEKTNQRHEVQYKILESTERIVLQNEQANFETQMYEHNQKTERLLSATKSDCENKIATLVNDNDMALSNLEFELNNCKSLLLAAREQADATGTQLKVAEQNHSKCIEALEADLQSSRDTVKDLRATVKSSRCEHEKNVRFIVDENEVILANLSERLSVEENKVRTQAQSAENNLAQLRRHTKSLEDALSAQSDTVKSLTNETASLKTKLDVVQLTKSESSAKISSLEEQLKISKEENSFVHRSLDDARKENLKIVEQQKEFEIIVDGEIGAMRSRFSADMDAMKSSLQEQFTDAANDAIERQSEAYNKSLKELKAQNKDLRLSHMEERNNLAIALSKAVANIREKKVEIDQKCHQMNELDDIDDFGSLNGLDDDTMSSFRSQNFELRSNQLMQSSAEVLETTMYSMDVLNEIVSSKLFADPNEKKKDQQQTPSE